MIILDIMLKQIKQINETLKIGDKFTIYYAPTYTKEGMDQTTIYKPHQYEVNVRSAIWTKDCKINRTGSLTYFDVKKNSYRTAIQTLQSIRIYINKTMYVWKKANNMDKDQYFVIRVWYFDYKDKDKYSYNIISDKAFSMDRALSVKIAQEIMESNPSISYKLQKVDLVSFENTKLAS